MVDRSTGSTSMDGNIGPMGGWKDKIDTFELNFVEPPSSGNVILDRTLIYMMQQSVLLKEAIEIGFRKLDQVIEELNKMFL